MSNVLKFKCVVNVKHHIADSVPVKLRGVDLLLQTSYDQLEKSWVKKLLNLFLFHPSQKSVTGLSDKGDLDMQIQNTLCCVFYC